MTGREREGGGIKKTRDIVPLLAERHAGSSRKQIRRGALGGVPPRKHHSGAPSNSQGGIFQFCQEAYLTSGDPSGVAWQIKVL